MKVSPRSDAAFTLVELMVSTAIIGLIMLVLVGMTNQISQTWHGTAEKIEKFQGARDGFESMTRKLAQATMNTSWEYLDATGQPRDTNVGSAKFNSFIPVTYGRATKLRFVSGPMNSAGISVAGFQLDPSVVRPGHGVFFQAPFGEVADYDAAKYGKLENLLNTWGYFVEAGGDPGRPSFVVKAKVPSRWRSRLMEFRLPTEQMSLYDTPQADYGFNWFNTHLNDTSHRPVRVLAENIITLVILPRLSKADEDARIHADKTASLLSPNYIYNSFLAGASTLNPGASPGVDNGVGINPKNQLPPILTVTMVAVDERSAQRLADKYCASAQKSADSQGTEQVLGGPSEMLMGLDRAANGVSGKAVTYSTLFTSAARLEDDPTSGKTGDGDLYDLQRVLTKEQVTYRVFTSNVSIRGAKWSRFTK